jgi:uncharacterized protein (DUF1800 family)
MERLHASIHGLTAIVLSCSLCFPAPLVLAQDGPGDPSPAQTKHRPEYAAKSEPGQLRGDERILHALNRFTFGPRPGDVDAVREMGLEKWFDEQLHPANIDETDLSARLAQYPAMQWSTQDLLFRMPSPAIIRQAANGKIEIPPSGTLHAVYENQIYRFQVRKAAQAERQNPSQVPNAGPPPHGRGPISGDPGPGAPAENQKPAASAEMDANASMTQNASGADRPSQVPESGPGAPADAGRTAMAQQREMSAAATPDMNAMMPAATDQAATLPAAAQPSVDQALVASILALPPEQRVRRLQAMQPEEFEAFIKSLKPAQRQALRAGMTPDLRESLDDLEAPEQTVVQELFAERLARDIYSNAQLQEVMTDFWLNHFNVYLRKNEQMPYYLVSYERDVIRPRALGKFEDLLEAVAHSPAMLIYLDNAESMGPDSMAAERAKMAEARRPNAKRQAPEGLNENYARELMELHTLGVNGGYTQADVIQVARVLTGWTVDRPQMGGGFQFNPNRHEPGTKKVMGTKIKENGEKEGRELLHMLAMRPATAQFLSRKLAIRFVSDDPPQALVDRMAKSYLASGGDIPTVLKTLFHSPEFWAASDYRAKVKTPLEFVVSAARASNSNIENFQPLVNALRQMGMPLYGCIPPVGYKWDEADWVSTGALVDRMNFALALAANRLPGITVVWAPELDLSALDSDAPSKQVVPTPESEEARLEPLLVAGGVSATTREAALEQSSKSASQQVSKSAADPTLNATSTFRMGHPGSANRAPAADAYEREDQLLAGLLLGSPEFQRR